jgi:hypothetical protein
LGIIEIKEHKHKHLIRKKHRHLERRLEGRFRTSNLVRIPQAQPLCTPPLQKNHQRFGKTSQGSKRLSRDKVVAASALTRFRPLVDDLLTKVAPFRCGITELLKPQLYVEDLRRGRGTFLRKPRGCGSLESLCKRKRPF